MKTPYAEARQLFPNIPEEIFSLWLDGRIEANGWPPRTPTWERVLRHKPISFWQALVWSKEDVKLELDRFTLEARTIVASLILAKFSGWENRVSDYMGSQSPEKMRSILEYLGTHHRLPDPIILFRDGLSYEIVDGCHRLAVFFLLQQRLGANSPIRDEQVAWVGELST